MDDDSIVIKLFRNGLDKGPEYRVTVYDSGKVIYEGIKNVKIKDKIETSISEEKIVFILENLKDSGIFNLNQKYSIDENLGRPFTRLTVEMPIGDGQFKTKSIVHYDDDPMIPQSIKNFENRIDEAVETYRWVKVPKPEKHIEPKPVNEAPTQKKPAKNLPIKEKKSNKKFIKIVVPVAIIIFVLLLVFFVFLNNDGLLSNEKPDTNFDTAEILNLYSTDSIFQINDPINIYFNYSNVTHNNKYDFSGTISLYKGQVLVDSYTFNADSLEDLEKNCSFNSDNSWPLGGYRVVFELTDHVSDLDTSLETTFTLYEKIPKIIVFTPVETEPSYKVYTPQSVFNLGDTFYVYVEYTGINTTNDNTKCNIFLSLNITDYNKNDVFWSYSEDKTNVGNNAHFWTISTDESWTSSLYNANMYIYDYNTGLSVSDSEILIIK